MRAIRQGGSLGFVTGDPGPDVEHDHYDPARSVAWPSAINVRLVGDDVRWDRLGPSPEGRGSLAPAAAAFDAFLALADGTDEQVRDFVARWGPLGICDTHGLPHVLTRSPLIGVEPDSPPCWTRQPAHRTDPIDRYRSLASQAVALLALTDQIRERAAFENLPRRQQTAPAAPDEHTQLYGREDPDDRRLATTWEMWQPLSELFRQPALEAHFERIKRPLPLSDEQAMLSHAIQVWLSIGEVVVRWVWQTGSLLPEIEVGSESLFGALALHLVTQSTRVSRLPVCVACGVPYTPQRRRNDNKYCRSCRETGLAKADQERRRRLRNKERAITSVAERRGND